MGLPELIAFTRWPEWKLGAKHVGKRDALPFGDLLDLLRERADTEHDGSGWSPGTFTDDHRLKPMAEELYAIGLDFDRGEMVLAELAKLFSNVCGFVHSTKSHTVAKPRCRVVIMSRRPIVAAEYAAIWKLFEARARGAGLTIDRQTKDCSRFWFWPCRPLSGEPGAFLVLHGAPIDPDVLLAEWAKCEAEKKPAPRAKAPTRTDVASALRRRASAYMSRVEPAVSGQAGHTQTFEAARKLVAFVEKGLPESDAYAILEAYNETCVPPWNEKELAHKWESAKGAQKLPAIEDRPAPARAQGDVRPADVVAGDDEVRSAASDDVRAGRDVAGRRFRCTDVGNAERLVAQHGAELRYCVDLGRLAWEGRYWKVDKRGEWVRRSITTVRGIYAEASRCDDSAVRKAIVDWAKKSEGASRLDAMARLAQSSDAIAITTDQLDRDTYALNVENGTIDLRTGKLREHDRSDLITRIAGTTYNPDARCPVFEAFLEIIFEKNVELIAFVQRFIGYALTGDVREQVLLFCYGSGANGKSTFIELVIDLLGGVGGYARPGAPGLLLVKKNEQHPTDLADLRGARLVSCVEIGEGKRFDEERVKALTGGDTIKARYMREDFFSFAPTHKLLLAANHKPEVRGTDHAIWRRILLVPFNVKFDEKDKDVTMPQKLRAELPGILAWAIRGCLEWQRAGLHPPPEVTGATKEYRAEMDQIGRFIVESCSTGQPALSCNATRLYKAYVEWAEKSGEYPITQTKFGTSLRERGFDRKAERAGIVWRGIGLRVGGVEGADSCGPLSGMRSSESHHEAPIPKMSPQPSTLSTGAGRLSS